MKESKALLWFRGDWHWLAVSILVAHFVLSAGYNLATPIWEGPDELGHYRYTRFLVTKLSLPGPGDSASPLDELTHPPLYYILTALATSWVDTSDELQPVENPYTPTGITEGGVNRFLHSDAEAFPYQGTVLAVHAARLATTLMGTLVVAVTYALGRLLFPAQRAVALGAMAINAFVPGFLFMSSVINNDMLVTLFFALALLFSVKVIVHSPRPRDLFAMGAFTGLALLSKNNAFALIPPMVMGFGVAMAKLLKSRGSLARSLTGVLLLLITLAAAYGWWLFRSVMLFGTATSRSQRLVATFVKDLGDPVAAIKRADWGVLPQALRYFYTSFWATFGWGNIGAEAWMYQMLGLLCLAGVSGFALVMLGKADLPVKVGVLLLLLSVVSLSTLAIYRTLALGDPVLRGRYALPGISAVSVILSLGIVRLTPRSFGDVPIFLAGLTMFLLGVIAPYRYILPAYARPPIFASDEALDVSNPLSVNFGNKIELLGYELGAQKVSPGEFVPLTLYWRCLAEMDENYTVGLAILGPDSEAYGQTAAHPGHGNYATSVWKPGKIVEDSYQIRVGRKFPAPSLARVYLALYTYPGQEHLFLLDSQGKPAERAVIFGRLAIVPAKPRDYVIEHPLYYELGDQIALVGYDIDGGMFNVGCVRVTLYWQSLHDMSEDYTVFVHLIDRQGRIHAQGDSQPRHDYWPTSYWERGEVVEDVHSVCLPKNLSPGKYKLATGLYLLRTMQRLGVLDQEGNPVPGDQIMLPDEIEPQVPDHQLYVPLVAR
jgi:4-amino-4-deoxy-L-arabinose transferase-like glycosyltransferase